MKKWDVAALLLLIGLTAIAVFLFIPNVPYQDRVESSRVILNSHISEFTEVAEKFVDELGPGSFCKRGYRLYRVDGNYFDFASQKFFIGGGPLGGDREASFSEVLEDTNLTNDEFIYYMRFLDQQLYIDCIEGIFAREFTGVEFWLPFRSNLTRVGFLYTDNETPDEKEYASVTPLDNEGWYLIQSIKY